MAGEMGDHRRWRMRRVERYLGRVEMMLTDRPNPDPAAIGYLLLAAKELWIGMGRPVGEFEALVAPLYTLVQENVVLLEDYEEDRPRDYRRTPSPLLSPPYNPPLSTPLPSLPQTGISGLAGIPVVLNALPGNPRDLGRREPGSQEQERT